jgi:tRNA(Ile)-lysidine synthase
MRGKAGGFSSNQAEGLELDVLNFIHRHGLLSAGQKVLVAVSGGADSVCLVRILFNLRDRLGISLHVAHLDHLLRGRESEADSSYVAEMAAGLGLPCTIEKRDVRAYQKQYRLSLEEAAREVRYKFLFEIAQKTGAQRVAAGHTRNDQVETILLHILRGAGMRGLTGLQPLQVLDIDSRNMSLIRPLLKIERVETEAYCAYYGLTPRQDSSNQSKRMLRNRVRHELLPLMQGYNAGISGSLLRLAEIAAEDLAYLDSQAAKAWLRVATWEGKNVILDKTNFRRLEVALQREVLRIAIHELSGTLKDIETRHVEQILRSLDKPTGKRLELPYRLIFSIDYGSYRLGSAPPETVLGPNPEAEYDLKIPGVSLVQGWKIEAELSSAKGIKVEANFDPYLACLDAELTGPKITLRSPRRGDRFQPLGMGQSKRLAEFLLDARVPRARRERVPILACHQGIIWVAGYRIDDRFKVTARSGQVLILRMQRVEAESPEGSGIYGPREPK